MKSRWKWIVRLLLRRIWFRSALFSIFSVALALLAAFVAPFIPYDINTKIGSDAVDNILGILASSMLAVTTFSLTAMVSAFSGASSTITPRAARLLVQDPTAQNALSTFLGAFLFAIVGICALSTGIYGKSGRVILFVGTIVVIAIIVLTLLRWIEHLSSFGHVGNTIERVERVTKLAMEQSGFRIQLTSSSRKPDPTRRAVRAEEIGYVTHIDLSALDDLAAREGCTIEVMVTPGAFVTPQRCLAQWDGSPQEDERVCDAFTIEHHRQFDHDPRFGLIVLSEIASRALSPGVNDPGTAIAVLGADVRVMADFLAHHRETEDDKEEPDRVLLPDLLLSDLLEDMIQPIARDGAGLVEVAIRLQRSLGEIAAIEPLARGALAICAAEAMIRCQEAMTYGPDLERVRGVYRKHWGATD